MTEKDRSTATRSGGAAAGRLTPCPSSPNCVSSDADPGDPHHVAPFRLAVPAAEAWGIIRRVIEDQTRTRIVKQTDRFLQAEFRTRILRFVDDLELQLRAAEGMIAVRSASRVGYSDLGVNRKRVEALRAELKKRGAVR